MNGELPLFVFLSFIAAKIYWKCSIIIKYLPLHVSCLPHHFLCGSWQSGKHYCAFNFDSRKNFHWCCNISLANNVAKAMTKTMTNTSDKTRGYCSIDAIQTFDRHSLRLPQNCRSKKVRICKLGRGNSLKHT